MGGRQRRMDPELFASAMKINEPRARCPKKQKNLIPAIFVQEHQIHLCSLVIQWDQSIQRNTDSVTQTQLAMKTYYRLGKQHLQVKQILNVTCWLNEKGFLGFFLCLHNTTHSVIQNDSLFVTWIKFNCVNCMWLEVLAPKIASWDKETHCLIHKNFEQWHSSGHPELSTFTFITTTSHLSPLSTITWMVFFLCASKKKEKKATERKCFHNVNSNRKAKAKVYLKTPIV